MAKQKIPAVLTAEERDRLVEVLGEASSSASERNLLMVRLMLDVGLRSAEVLSLRHKDIDWNSGELRVLGKGKKERILWLDEQLVARLREHVEREHVARNDLIFRSRTGKPVTTRYLRYMVKDLGEKAGLTKDLHPHTLRHTFATDLLRSTKNLVMVSKALGHANIGTTTIYTHICDPEMEAAMKGLRNGNGNGGLH